jgi:DNA-binding transcriptional ArsR family regulator
MRSTDRALRREIERYGWAFRTHIPDIFLPRARLLVEPFEDELLQLRRSAPAQLLDAFSRPLFDHGGKGVRRSRVRAMALERAAASGAGALATAVALFDDPLAFTADLSTVLEAYWEEVFEREWARLDEPLARSVSEATQALTHGRFSALLGRLPPNCRRGPDDRELFVDLPHEHAVEASPRRPLVLSPTFFAWPHLIVSCDAPWPLAIAYTPPLLAREAELRLPPPADLLTTLRALADDTRLRILELIAERPRTSQELEPLVGLSRAGVSKAVRRLAEPGLITGKREGFYMVYSLDRTRLQAIAPDLAEYLDK